MRGMVPMGLTAPRVATSVMLSPERSESWSASRRPIATPCPSVEAAECALLHVIDDGRQQYLVLQADAADQHTAGVERRGRQRLAFHDRRRQPDAFDAGDARGNVFPIGERLFQRLDQQMAIEAENLVEQFLAKAVHYRHHD